MSILEDARVTLELTLAARMGLAALLGFLIGLERESRGKIAGERTFAIVALGAAAVLGTALALAILEFNRLPGLRGVHRRVIGRPDMDDEDQT